MRPTSATFSSLVELPDWLYELRRQLSAGGAQAPPETLGPLTAIEELRSVATAVLNGLGPPQRPADCRSLRDDFIAAFEALGPHLAATTQPTFEEFSPSFAQLEELIKGRDGAQLLKDAVDEMERCLLKPSSVSAAWDDVVGAFQGDEDAEACELRLMQLRELCERRGRDWRQLASGVTGIINDDLAYLSPDLAEIPPACSPDRLAGVPDDKRLLLARELVQKDAATGEVTVWVAFQNAVLRSLYQRLGPVEFFACQLWPKAARKGNFNPDEEPPPELQDEDFELSFEGLPDEGFVLARVRLGEGHLSGAKRRARQLALDLVHAARPESEWVLMEGAASYQHGAGWGFNDFRDPELTAAAYRRSPQSEATSYYLGHLSGDYATALANGASAALEAAEYVRWDHAVGKIPDAAQRIGLSIRIFEQALFLNPEGKSNDWRRAVEHYLRDEWCEHRLAMWLRDAVFAMLDALPGQGPRGSAEERQRQTDLREELMPSTGDLAFDFYAGRALQQLPGLAAEMPEGSMEHRLLLEVSRRTQDGKSAVEWLDLFGRRFDRLLARAVRQRNAALHGRATVPAVLESVEPFISQLAGRVIGDKLHCAVTGTPLLEEMENVRAASLERRSRLEAGRKPEEVLFQSV